MSMYDRDWYRYGRKCSDCENPIYPNQVRCSFCGRELAPDPPPQGTLDWKKERRVRKPVDGSEIEQQALKEERPTLQQCRLCRQISLFWNDHDRTYECLNHDCRATGDTTYTLFSWKVAVQRGRKRASSKAQDELEDAPSSHKKAKPTELAKGGHPTLGAAPPMEQTVRREQKKSSRKQKQAGEGGHSPPVVPSRQSRGSEGKGGTASGKKSKVARRGPTTEGRAWWGDEYYDARSRRWKKPTRRRSASVKQAFLILLVVVCLGVAFWNAYLLFTDQISSTVGWIILAASIAVLLWNISVLKSYRIRITSVVGILVVVLLIGGTVAAYVDIEPFAGLRSTILNGLAGAGFGYDVQIVSGQQKTVDGWVVRLDGGGWKGSTVIVDITITNLGKRRAFGYAGLSPGPQLAAIDSTNKLAEPSTPRATWREPFPVPPYTKEFYPNESWSGRLKFEMSPYSGQTKLYMTRYYHVNKVFLFDLRAPNM